MRFPIDEEELESLTDNIKQGYYQNWSFHEAKQLVDRRNGIHIVGGHDVASVFFAGIGIPMLLIAKNLISNNSYC